MLKSPQVPGTRIQSRRSMSDVAGFARMQASSKKAEFYANSTTKLLYNRQYVVDIPLTGIRPEIISRTLARMCDGNTRQIKFF